MKKIYQGDNNFVFDEGGNIENEFLVGSIDSAANDMYWKRPKEDINLLPHDAGAKHPNNPLMVTSFGSHILTSGSIEIEWSWTEEDSISLEHARNFAHYLDSAFPETENTIEMSIGANGYIKQFAKANGSVTDFAPIRPEYTLNTDASILLHKGSSYLCVLRTDPNADEWFSTYRDAQAGDTITLEPVGTKTYFIFGSVVQKDGQNLEKHKAYKVTREIEITCPEFTKIVRVHRE